MEHQITYEIMQMGLKAAIAKINVRLKRKLAKVSPVLVSGQCGSVFKLGLPSDFLKQ